MLDIKWKNNSKASILLVILCAALAGTIMCNMYPYFRARAARNMEEYKKIQDTASETFYVNEDFERYLLSTIYYLNYETIADMDAYEYFTQGYNMEKLSKEEQERIQEAANRLMKNMRNQYVNVQGMNGYVSFAVGVDKNFGADPNLGEALYGNREYVEEYYQSGVVIAYDARGVPAIRSSWNMEMNETELQMYLHAASMGRLLEDNGMDYGYEIVYEDDYEITTEAYTYEIPLEDSVEQAQSNDVLLRQIPLPPIQNATFVFGIRGGEVDHTWDDYWIERQAYTRSGYMIVSFLLIAVMMVLALVLQNVPALALRENRIFKIPTEIVAIIGMIGFALTCQIEDFGISTLTSDLAEEFGYLGLGDMAGFAATAFVWLFWTGCAFGWYWLTASALPYITHPIRTIREHALCVGFCKWLRDMWLRIWRWATDVELDENLTRNIWKIVGINGLIVAALCCIWIGGIPGALIYSIILYILMKRKCAEILDSYRKLLHVTRSIAEGDLNAPTDEDMGLLNPVRDELAAIQAGFKRAVDEEVKSRNMKTELITNVSHDLKTPLTAIITYVDLLKKEDITEDERRAYIDTLDRKSQRLKMLIEDLFEVSKAATDNITMNYEDVDLVNLMKQVRLENGDKIEESTLDFRFNLLDEKCILYLDPQRTFRIIDNLVQNILKYSMPHSRVYIDMRDVDGEVVINFKNMSAQEMNFSPEEITERFVRGDLSRNTEGSGLGLAIAQSFTELQGGTFKVETDGDLFKVTICWKKARD